MTNPNFTNIYLRNKTENPFKLFLKGIENNYEYLVRILTKSITKRSSFESTLFFKDIFLPLYSKSISVRPVIYINIYTEGSATIYM